MIGAWLSGLLKTRAGRILGTIAGIAMAVALLADLGAFIQRSAETLTARAVITVPVDWQVELVPGADAKNVTAAINAAIPSVHLEQLGYADVAGFEFTTADGTQSTGAGKAVGLTANYATILPAGFRMLAGDMSGAVLLQQTAANLHAAPGDTITLHRLGLPDATVIVSGIVDLKSADTFFQAIGVPAGAAPQAPPDNAVLLPIAAWHGLFDEQAVVRPQNVRAQIHAVLDHTALPQDPTDAYSFVSRAGHNFEARVAGSALLANNLAAQLDAARGDSLYARVLFLFLGAPGIILAALLTFVLAASGTERRRRDQSLLRLRGASNARIVGFAAIEAASVGIAGGVVGIVLALVAAPLLGLPTSGSPVWSGLAGVGGLLLAAAAILVPAWRSAQTLSVAAARRTLGSEHPPLWERLYIDLMCLALAGVVFWQTAAGGYQVVLATEGVSAISVDYNAFLAPLLLWIGAGLLTIRLVRLLLDRGRRATTALAAPITGGVAPAVAASLARQRRRLSLGAAFVALTLAFAVSTAIFNTTYQGQARVDALLTNGADVTVTGTTSAPAAAVLEQLRAISDVAAAEPMQHRYAYVGTDLQDLYGIDPNAIGNATTLSNAYFANHDASGTLALLASTPNAVLVSDETVTDFQLKLGDTINLRLQGADGTYKPIPFVFAGIVREFPTAPRDSFIVANASYIAQTTGVASNEVVLMRTSGAMGDVKRAASGIVSGMSGVKVTDLTEATHTIGSSLTAVDLGGLTRLELSFGILLAIGASGLAVALGLADRRRSFAILSALGAKPRQMTAFIAAEALLILCVGVVFGGVLGWAIAQILVTVLQGVFDPPPETLSVPWSYLVVIAGVATLATTLTIWNGVREASIDTIRRIRELQ